MNAVRQLRDKFSAADPFSTSTVKKTSCRSSCAVHRRSVQSFVGSRSLPRGFQEGVHHSEGEEAKRLIIPADLEPASVVETPGAPRRPPGHGLLQSADLLPANQSVFRPGHATETAVLRVLSGILLTVDRGDVAALILLDLSAAFDTIDYEILLQHLQTTYGICDVTHRWFRSYLLGRSQYVRIWTSCSSVIDLICSVPQGSVLGPVLFILYTAGLIYLIESHGLTPHLLCRRHTGGSCPASNVDAFSAKLTACSCAVKNKSNYSNRYRIDTQYRFRY